MQLSSQVIYIKVEYKQNFALMAPIDLLVCAIPPSAVFGMLGGIPVGYPSKLCSGGGGMYRKKNSICMAL